MPTITGFDVAIGNTDTWVPVQVVPADPSRKLGEDMPAAGKEYRYWRVKVTENGVTEEIEGRLLIAGGSYPTPPVGSVVVPRGSYRTWTRIINSDEHIITSAGILSVV